MGMARRASGLTIWQPARGLTLLRSTMFLVKAGPKPPAPEQ
jgi:hypothetical protein